MIDFGKMSPKQLKVLSWWSSTSPDKSRDAVICDGAVRSGKTVCMTLSFVLWAMGNFRNCSFGICGKTGKSVRRNIVTPIFPELKSLGFRYEEKISENLVTVSFGKMVNRFYIFGGRDESSASLIQGMTLAGVMFDEVALMPKSFVEQAMARCSVEGSKLWFNCNPGGPDHWFYREWIKNPEEKNALYFHFTMEDNPSLSKRIKKRYERLYTGVFYERYIEGKWVRAEGLVYPFFNRSEHVKICDGECTEYAVSCDYGTINPVSMGLWGRCGGVWYRIKEYYFDSRREGYRQTDEEYYKHLEELCGEKDIRVVVVDPSASSFIECIKRHGKFNVIKAVNNVADGIRNVSDCLKRGEIYIDPVCMDCIREFGLYRWKDGIEKEEPVKENDHAMDDMRYFVSTILLDRQEEFFFVGSVER